MESAVSTELMSDQTEMLTSAAVMLTTARWRSSVCENLARSAGAGGGGAHCRTHSAQAGFALAPARPEW